MFNQQYSPVQYRIGNNPYMNQGGQMNQGGKWVIWVIWAKWVR